ncbi:MAG: cyclopropane-fatty-acyl-phospholipid synthase family protein [Gemmatimonadales bacterium]
MTAPESLSGPDAVVAGEAGVTDVADYYERNTARFLFMGGGDARAMHRELWGPGVTSSRGAVDHIDELLAAELADLSDRADALVLDFGCGVGGTVFRLAERLPAARFYGMTVSRRQVELAERLAASLGWSARCSFTLGDFHATDLEVRAQAVVAVESFAHSTRPGAFFANASRHLERGGRLLVADDFLTRDEGALDPAHRAHVERFRRGWRVPAVATFARVERDAAEHGLTLEKNVDLTPLTRPGARLRDRIVALTNPALVRFDTAVDLTRIPFFGNLIGGHALQTGLRSGFLEYRLLVFRKVA